MSSTVVPSVPEQSSPRTLRRDAWWVEPLLIVVVLVSFGIYSFWAALQNAHYYAAPYLSPFYSPCLAVNCAHVTIPIVGSWWNLSPAFLILWAPLAFRATCYYYRRSYYRAFFWSPPACAVRGIPGPYNGETRFPFIINNLHRYTLYASSIVVAFLWWDAIQAFGFPDGFGMGVGTLVLLANAALLSLYTLSCHSCRYLCGGHLDVLTSSPLRLRLFQMTNKLNPRHGFYAWISLFGVAFADVYVRLVSMGIINDVRFF